MLDITNLWLFILSVFLLSITPGPDMAYVVGQSVANGRRAGVISAAGVALGSCTHAVASVVGLTALIAASPLMFSAVKYAGALYLIYLGSKMIIGTFNQKSAATIEQPRVKINAPLKDLLSKGFITTLTNPKVLLFFVSFFPQFVVPNGAHQTESFLVLGLAYALVAFLTDAMFALLAGSAAGAVSQNRSLQKLMDRVVGSTFIALGVRLAFTRR
ncbi:LysE family translocator [Pseudomonas sp. SbB1]|uniref:Lysine exporter protein (LYSE/YGGA) n=1 Tax=Pseudomonas putida (strain GB-1) TaxID=76869 RepID=B0KJP8_PSEPG|nr:MULTISPECIES: LysE family translocator [Pseudomonas]ABY99276.1 Lysine exporter protein (LYSE/YGGA) [Pseudomonas putida GB-1]MBP0706889.1 LysE family translocator [Pseudomonas sp. T34]MCK2186327.1 LysE family translocator [Pseudomonas sp. MB04B]MDD2083566.1 LysE family translocator [Pseudomonas putida]MDD2093532.1 LysE family translocator [Pseudomonas putida]